MSFRPLRSSAAGGHGERLRRPARASRIPRAFPRARPALGPSADPDETIGRLTYSLMSSFAMSLSFVPSWYATQFTSIGGSWFPRRWALQAAVDRYRRRLAVRRAGARVAESSPVRVT